MNSFYRQIFDMFLESQYWPPEQMLAYQRSQIAQLIEHARTNVPFYRTRLDPIFDSSGNIDWDQWSDIPIVKRNSLIDDRESMLAAQLPPGHGTMTDVHSSGSSGRPITTTHCDLARWTSEMAVYRAHTWHGMDWSKNFLILRGDVNGKARWPQGWNRGRWGPAWLEPNSLGTRYELDRTADEEKIFEFMRRKKIDYVTGGPTVLHALALAAERMRESVRISALVISGGGVTEMERDDMQRIFGARVISLYSSGEGYKIGISCSNSLHHHVNSELSFLEILDDNDRPCEIGQPGRVIITPFLNSAQPLIRYEQGDIAVRGKNCPCGRTLPILQRISGRINDLFELPGNRKIAAFLPDKEFSLGFGSKSWQLAQTAPLTVELRFVPTSPEVPVNRKFAETMIREKIHPELEVAFIQLERTPLTAAGKFIQFRCELQSRK
jgi:phenylacetate-CoA ligase